MASISERLKKAAGGGPRIADFEDQVVTVVSIEKEPSKFEPGNWSVKATIVDENGDESWFFCTPTSGNQLMEIEADLPLELKIVAFPGQFGKTGYMFEEA